MKNDSLVGTHQAIGGFMWGAAFSWHFDSRDSLRIRLDLSGINHSSDNTVPNPPLGNVTLNSEWSIPEIGLDWRRDWTDGNKGWFGEAGIGLASPKLSLTSRFPISSGGPMVGNTKETRQDRKLALRLGAGYNFSKRIYAGVGLHSLSVDKNGADGFPIGNLTWAECSLGVRFGMPK